MTMTGTNAITAIQGAYVKKVIDTIHAEPGVLWKIREEAPCGSGWWQSHIMNLIHTYESATYEVRHPVGYPTLNISCPNDASLRNSNADWVAPVAVDFAYVLERVTGL
jgi:hypothetical protein